jgi:hypothetical protein
MQDQVTVPDFMPALRKGPGASPAFGGCIMQYCAWITGDQWTDHPACTHPNIASAAITVNDNLSDEDRHLLVPLIGRLIKTPVPADDVMATRVRWALYEFSMRSGDELTSADPKMAVKALQRMIDVYFRLTRRPCPGPVPEARLQEAAQAISQEKDAPMRDPKFMAKLVADSQAAFNKATGKQPPVTPLPASWKQLGHTTEAPAFTVDDTIAWGVPEPMTAKFDMDAYQHQLVEALMTGSKHLVSA